MFDIGWSEMAIILVVALIVIGPRDLPRVAKTLGKWVGKGRALAREFQSQLEDMAREAELDEVKRGIEKAGRGNLKSTVRNTIEKSIDPDGDLADAFDPGSDEGKRKTAKKAESSKPKAPAPKAAKPKASDTSTGSPETATPAEPKATNGSAEPMPAPEAKPAADDEREPVRAH